MNFNYYVIISRIEDLEMLYDIFYYYLTHLKKSDLPNFYDLSLALFQEDTLMICLESHRFSFNSSDYFIYADSHGLKQVSLDYIVNNY